MRVPLNRQKNNNYILRKGSSGMLQIDDKFKALKFSLVEVSDGSLILKYDSKSIFFISSNPPIEGSTLNRICEDYLKIVSSQIN